jgi:cytochrome c peroxidase
MRTSGLFLTASIAAASIAACAHHVGQLSPAASSGAPREQPPGTLITTPPFGANPAQEGEAVRVPELPIGVSPTLYAISVPAGKEPTPDRVALGAKLFVDKRLSVDNTVACDTCHDVGKGFVDHKPTSEGVRKQRGQRNAPTILNAMFNATQFWDGRAPTLEEQAKLPILNPIEMGQRSPDDVVRKVRSIPALASQFQRIYGHDATYDDIADAIAAFERTKFAGNAPFDRFIQGDENALDASQKRGWALFNGKGRCSECHAGNAVSPLFSDQKFHNIGIAAHKQNFPDLAREALRILRTGDQKQIDELAIGSKFTELGRFLITKSPGDIGAVKTPNLRNVAVTAPYMHDGELATLWDVMDHYNKGGVPNPFLDGGMQRLGLSEAEIDDMVHFLFALTSDEWAEFAKTEVAAQTAKKNVRPQRETDVALGRRGNLGDVAPNPDVRAKNPANLGDFGKYKTGGANDGH